jgi:cytochrome c oxidase cbb3-type subunit 4
MDIDLLRGLALVLLIVAFIAVCVWAWSSKRKKEFDTMSRLPLEEDSGRIPDADEEKD